MFAISCKISSINDKRAMCDLCASINVMPLSIYNSLNTFLKKTSVIIQLAGKSVVYSKDVLKDILIQVGGLDFLIDFYVLDMKEDKSSNSLEILLGRAFFNITRVKIDVHDETLSMELMVRLLSLMFIIP